MMLRLSFLLAIVVLSTTVIPAYANHCGDLDVVCWIKEAIDGVEKIPKDIESAATDVKNDVKKVEDKVDSIEKSIGSDLSGAVTDVKNDVKKVEDKVDSIEKSIGKDIGDEISDIKKDVTDIKNDAESLEHTVVNEIKEDVNTIKEDVNRISEFIKTDEKKLEEFVETVEKLEKIIGNDVFEYFWYIVGAVIAILAGILGIKIYESYRKHEVINAILEINKNLAKLANKGQ
ncbi:MAG: hypothetical protein ACW9W3_07585 [Candidatus Nitrosopumilus sp. bin_68KS]